MMPGVHVKEFAEFAGMGVADGSLAVQSFVHVASLAEDWRQQFRRGFIGMKNQKPQALRSSAGIGW